MAAQDPGNINNDEFKIHVTHIPTGEKVDFKGWVTGFADNFQSQWTGTPVYGRMDDLYTFQKTSRRISLAFDVIAAGPQEAMRNVANLNKLTQFLYPVYSDPVAKNPGVPARNSQVLQAAPLLKLRWNGLVRDASTGEDLVGFLAGLIYQPVIDSGQFFSTKASAADILYQQHTVQLEFTVLHTHLTGWTKDGNTLTFGGNSNIQKTYPHATADIDALDLRAGEILGGMIGVASELGIEITPDLFNEYQDEAYDVATSEAVMGEPPPPWVTAEEEDITS